jgi:hypothetical protein
MKFFKDVREFFWPLLEPELQDSPSDITPNDINVQEEYLEKALEFALQNYYSEEERRKSIETKSALFIGTTTAATTIIIASTSIIAKKDGSYVMSIMLTLLCILVVYVARTIWFALQALERKGYHTISTNDYLTNSSELNYYKSLVAKVINKTAKNSKTINRKVDSMTMAQEYFKRAIVTISIFPVLTLIYFAPSMDLDLTTFFREIRNAPPHVWNLITIYSLIIVSLIIGIRATIKIKRK